MDSINTSGLSTTAVVFAVIAGIAIWLVFIIAYIKVIMKAGYSGWWIFILLVPIVNVVMLLVFAYKEWPIQRELAELRGWAGQIQRGAGAPAQPGYGQQGYRPEGFGKQG